METKFNAILMTIGGILGYLVGGLDSLFAVFATVLVIDTLTGMLKAWNLGEYNSSKFRGGLAKKTGYLFAVLLSVQLDILTGNTGALRTALILTFTANESLSVVENLGTLGIPFPDSIMNAIEILKNKNDTKNK